MEKKYNHKNIEKYRYQQWLEQKLFSSNLNSKKPKFCIVLPPPNITGQLHLGHAWDATIQDALIRYKHLKGYETLFIPGTDHAGIATQIKVLATLKENNNEDLVNLDQNTFFNAAWKWKDKHNKIIHQQWANLGLALDYSKEKFTLDDSVQAAVKLVFVELYQKKLIYQGLKVVNWDPLLKTAISNIEVNYQEVKGKLYYLKYFLADKSNYLVVATTRPETMFADQALIVNGKDKRYQKFINKMVINPANNQLIKVISDDYVDKNFGTGVMKCTPGHDFNDYQIGLKYNLPLQVCFDEQGKINLLGGKYCGLDRFVCRKKLITDLEKLNLVVKVEDYLHQVGFSERTNVIVEPYLSKQWFINMEPIAKQILQLQADKKNKIIFFPEFFEEQLLKWVNNIQDWCISRQLLWGHKIPVWYHKKTQAPYVSTSPPKNINDYVQDEDVLDTWFSSALWPLVTLNWPDKNSSLFKNYYPTNVLVTAYDILFFWVVRMIFMGLEFSTEKPFSHVLIHGLIRDEQGRKMSKSLNNGINPQLVIDQYGADALRYFLVSNSAPGQDLRFSNIKINAAAKLINKLWNAARYVLLNLPKDFKIINNFTNLKLSYIDQWILIQLNQLIVKVEKKMNEYDFVVVNHDLANFIWNQYCSWYIELSKVNLQNETLNRASLVTLTYVLKQIIIMLHPFMPFVTEEIYQKINDKNSILSEQYAQIVKYYFNDEAEDFVISLSEIITVIRTLRKDLMIDFKTKLELHINTNKLLFSQEQQQFNQYLLKLTNSEIVSVSKDSFNNTKKISKVINNAIVEVKTTIIVNHDQELMKFKNQLKTYEIEIAKTQKLLNNQQFLAKTEPKKIQLQKERLEHYQKQWQMILKRIEELKQK